MRWSVLLVVACAAPALAAEPTIHELVTRRPPDLEAIRARIAADPGAAKARDSNRSTPLHLAAQHSGSGPLVELLLASGADLEARNAWKQTALHCAVLVQGASPDIVAALLARKADVAARDHRGGTPLHHAVRSSDLDATEALLAAGADREAKDDAGRTPFLRAAELGYGTWLAWLIARKFDPRARDAEGKSGLDLVAAHAREDVRGLLEGKTAPEAVATLERLFDAITKGNLLEVRLLHALDPKVVKAAGNDGTTALHVAIGQSKDGIFAKLLEWGASPTARTRQGRTPLHWTADSGRVAMAKRLLDLKVDIDAKDEDDMTPLHVAAGYGEKELVALLLDRGAKVGARTRVGQTPLHIAAMPARTSSPEYTAERNRAKVAAAEALLAKKADPNAADKCGWTPLHFAAGWDGGFPDMVTLLLKKKANPRLKTKDKEPSTPLELARRYKHEAAAKALEKR